MNQLFLHLLGIRSDFQQLFFTNEYTALSGKKKRTIIALVTILSLTFLALGFAVGGRENLQQKMENPFTNWVDLEVNNYVSQNSSELQEHYSKPEMLEKFQMDNTNGFSRYTIDFCFKNFDPFQLATADKNDSYQGWGRTIEPDESIFAKVLDANSGNLVCQKEETLEDVAAAYDGCGIIVSEDLLQQLGYKDPCSVDYLVLQDDYPIIVAVVAVVKELPTLCKFATSAKLYNILKRKSDGGRRCDNLIKVNQEGDNRFLLLTKNAEAAQQLPAAAGAFFGGPVPSLEAEYEYQIADEKWQGSYISFLPTDAPTLDSMKLFVQSIKKNIPAAEYATLECGSSLCRHIDPKDLHYIAFNFVKLDLIRAFRDDLEKEFGIPLDMSQVDSKENFALVSRLTFFLSLILLGFGILSIVLFVNNLLRNHLFEVRSNLGTFQAFGLSNRFLVNTYLKIIFSFLLLSIGLAFILAAIVDRLEQYWMGNESRFDLFNVVILAAIAVLVLISLLLSNRTIKRILGDTPGNLIYER
ncbi:MAG: hypothetical protein R2830_07120 [Saprospiraceae bacterium]